jgi:hypothetical protein
MDCLSDKPRGDAPRKLDDDAAQRLRHWARDQPLSAPEMLQRHTDDEARHLGKSDGVLRECAQVNYAFIKPPPPGVADLGAVPRARRQCGRVPQAFRALCQCQPAALHER